ncbi:hypothetical protein QUF99_09480 [Bacillus sp. DX4.1]|nr:hypothetical protein [Bacillus sp. DX4.1]MDM5187545.1 hypothetical protein [Bacillus sp. DX4.1]
MSDYIRVEKGVTLYVEDLGEGTPIVLIKIENGKAQLFMNPE